MFVDPQIWTKYSGQPAYRKEAKLYLPGKTLEEIEQHEEWHHELIYLQDKKRDVNVNSLALCWSFTPLSDLNSVFVF